MAGKKSCRYTNKILETDELRVIGIGTAEIKGYSVITKLSLDYLERAIKIVKELHKGEIGITIDIALGGDSPLVIGEYNEKTSAIAGVIIAPRVESK